jgi:hypothetical protein
LLWEKAQLIHHEDTKKNIKAILGFAFLGALLVSAARICKT